MADDKNGTSSMSRKGYRNPAETVNPDAATLREQWSFAKKQYSRWYSSAWGTAILAGLSFYALGWIIKGENPIPSFNDHNHNKNKWSKDDHRYQTPKA